MEKLSGGRPDTLANNRLSLPAIPGAGLEGGERKRREAHTDRLPKLGSGCPTG